MLLTITYTGQNATDLGFLLHKNPNRAQSFELPYGKAHVFYPEASQNKATAALLLSIDPIILARGKAGSRDGGLFDYVNDRPYVSSSFMSTAISKVFGTAMAGRCDKKQELADTPLALAVRIAMLPCKGEPELARTIFEPLGYTVSYKTFLADERFPEWGQSKYINLDLQGTVKLGQLLNHIYVLLPVFDRQKHYWIDKAETEKLLTHGEGWLAGHPHKGIIVGRYLNRKKSLVNLAMKRLLEDDLDEDEHTNANPDIQAKTVPLEPEIAEKKVRLNDQRYEAVLSAVRQVGAKSVIDMGCGEGNLLVRLLKERNLEKIAGMDVAFYTLERAREKLKLDRRSDAQVEKLELFQGSLTYRDKRLEGYDVACVVEVIEHMDTSRLIAFSRVLFQFASPKNIIMTTPNKSYNVNYENLLEGNLRHGDHRFEWTQEQFQVWAEEMADTYGYTVRFSPVGEVKEGCGAPTQMGVFTRCE